MDAAYKKRAGTSGISGQLYETKLISLILFRLLHDDKVEEFYLSSNMDDVGAFDDITFKAKLKGIDKPILIFVQAKHKEDDDKYVNFDLVKNFYTSYMKVKQKLNSTKAQDKIFDGKFDDTECLFILYTNAKCYDDSVELLRSISVVSDSSGTNTAMFKQARKPYQSIFADDLNHLLATSDKSQGSQPDFTNEDIEFVGKTILSEEIATLAEHFIKFLNDQSMNIMNDEYIMRYHVILANSVVNLSKPQPEEEKPGQNDVKKWRMMTFRPEFFETEDTILVMLREKLYELIGKVQARKKTVEADGKKQQKSGTRISMKEDRISPFLNDPNVINLSLVIDTFVIYKNGRLEFTTDRPKSDLEKLEEISNNILPSTILEAKAIVAKNVLISHNLKVPVEFGNIDLAIRGSVKKIDRRLVHLTNTVSELCEKSKSVGSNIVTIDESLGEGFLSSNGGLGGAVGNLLVLDPETKLLKVTEDSTLLNDNSKALFEKLNAKINDLGSYRFNVKAVTFPRLAFDCTDEARGILTKLVIYEKQSNHRGVEDILKEQIERHQKANNPNNFQVKSDSVLQNYHNEIQKWWMSPYGLYITKKSDVYQQAINNIVIEPQMSALQHMFYINNMANIKYTFNEKSIEKFQKIKESSSTFIISDTITLTTNKVIQCLRENNEKWAVLDLKCILNLPNDDFKALKKEIKNTDKIPIVVCEDTQKNRTLHKRLDDIAEATEHKKAIVISITAFVEMGQEYFPDVKNVIHDVEQSLTDMNAESQKEIIKNSQVIFQGQKIGLDLFVDDVSVEFIKGSVLRKMINKEDVIVGESLSNKYYEEIKHLYVDRKVSQAPKDTDDMAYSSEDEYAHNVRIRKVRNFQDIKNNVVLITAKPGMGKSTLLTHLSLRTKETNKKIWIVRVNLLDYSKVFYSWPDDKNIDTIETLKFICQVIIKNHDIPIKLKEVNNKVYLEECGAGEWATFELNMFLHFYNKRNLLLLFDGFDEICPHYKNNIIKFFNAVKQYPRKNKMWVTSRPYSEILPDLQKALGKSYEIEYLDDEEQQIYLKAFWQEKVIFQKLNEAQVKNVISFIDFMTEMLTTSAAATLDFRFSRIYYIFYEYVYSHFPHVDPTSHSPYAEKFNPNFAPITADTESLELDKFFDEKIDRDQFPVASTSGRNNRRVDKLMGTPLLLYLVADYFVNVIDVGKTSKTWELDINIHNIYEMFIETKLKKILYQDKNKMDVYNPDIILKYENERTYCIHMHKKIGAHAILKGTLFNHEYELDEFKDMQPFDRRDFKEFEAMIDRIKTGKEKTGLISHVTADNIPVFIHRTFAEYCAAEFLCDIIKSDRFEFANKELLYTALMVLNIGDILPFISKKREIDSELNSTIIEIESKRPTFLTWYRLLCHSGDWSYEKHTRLMSSLLEDYSNDSFSEYNDDYFINFIQRLQWKNDENELHISEVKKNLVAKMKPNFKRFIIAFKSPPGTPEVVIGAGGPKLKYS